MEILKSSNDWSSYKGKLLQKFNLGGDILTSIRGEPAEFPCMVVSCPVVDVNGYNIRCFFFTHKDAYELIDAVIHPD